MSQLKMNRNCPNKIGRVSAEILKRIAALEVGQNLEDIFGANLKSANSSEKVSRDFTGQPLNDLDVPEQPTGRGNEMGIQNLKSPDLEARFFHKKYTYRMVRMKQSTSLMSLERARNSKISDSDSVNSLSPLGNRLKVMSKRFASNQDLRGFNQNKMTSFKPLANGERACLKGTPKIPLYFEDLSQGKSQDGTSLDPQNKLSSHKNDYYKSDIMRHFKHNARNDLDVKGALPIVDLTFCNGAPMSRKRFTTIQDLKKKRDIKQAAANNSVPLRHKISFQEAKDIDNNTSESMVKPCQESGKFDESKFFTRMLSNRLSFKLFAYKSNESLNSWSERSSYLPFKDQEYWGQQGFENCCKFIKSGSHFCRDIASILQERADLESQYYKNLNKLSAKLVKTAQHQCQQLLTLPLDSSHDSITSSNNDKKKKMEDLSEDVRKSLRKKAFLNTGGNASFAAWEVIGKEMDAEAQIHKNLSLALVEDLAKPLNSLSKAHSEARKNIEAVVEKACKTYDEARAEETKDKTASFEAHKNLERLRDSADNNRSRSNGGDKSNNGSSMSEKELLKVEEKICKGADSCKKVDHSYHDSCIKAERCRQERDQILDQSYSRLHELERERFRVSREVLVKYLTSVAVIPSKLNQVLDNISQAVLKVKPVPSSTTPSPNSNSPASYSSRGRGGTDSSTYPSTDSGICAEPPQNPLNLIRAGGNDFRLDMADQYLFDFYPEDFSNPMNTPRRKQSLERVLVILRQDIEKEKAARESVIHLSQVYKDIPKFSDQSSVRDIKDKLLQCHHMSNLLEASFFKVACALAELQGQPKPTTPLSKYIETKRSKHGILNSVLRVPPWDEQVGLVKFNRTLESLMPENVVMLESITSNNSSTSSYSSDRTQISENLQDTTQQSPPSDPDPRAKMRKSGRSGGNKGSKVDKDHATPRIGCGLSFTGMGRNIFGRPITAPKHSRVIQRASSQGNTTQSMVEHAQNNLPASAATTNRTNQEVLMEDDSTQYPYLTPPTSTTDVKGRLLYEEDRALNHSRSDPNILQQEPPPSYYANHLGPDRVLDARPNRVCIVKYEYNAARPDELSIKPGDIIEILHKQVDGWWQGCKIVPNGEIGIFPSTYVQELAVPSPTSSNPTSASQSPSPSAPRMKL